MTLEEKIHELVNALTPSEKGYIKKFARASLPEKKCRLIDRWFGTRVPDRSEDEWVFDFLLSCLEEYHKNERTEMRGMLNQIDVLLVDKDLPGQAEKLIHRARKIAEKARSTEMLMEISELETALLAIKPPSDELIAQMEKTFEDLQELSDEHDSHIFKKIKDVEKP